MTTAQKRQLEIWQYLKNDLLGQIILSFHLQHPGTARSAKKKIFSVTDVYERIFKRRFDKENIIDLLKLNSFYSDFLNRSLSEELFTSGDQESVATNGRYIILGIVGFMIKEKRNFVDLRLISNEEEWEQNVSQDCLEGSFFSTDFKIDEIEERLFGYFNDIIIELEDLYKSREKEEKTVSNFFKLDSKYLNVILKRFVDRWHRQGVARWRDRIHYLEIFN